MISSNFVFFSWLIDHIKLRNNCGRQFLNQTSSCALTMLTAMYVKNLWSWLAAFASGDASPNPAFAFPLQSLLFRLIKNWLPSVLNPISYSSGSSRAFNQYLKDHQPVSAQSSSCHSSCSKIVALLALSFIFWPVVSSNTVVMAQVHCPVYNSGHDSWFLTSPNVKIIQHTRAKPPKFQLKWSYQAILTNDSSQPTPPPVISCDGNSWSLLDIATTYTRPVTEVYSQEHYRQTREWDIHTSISYLGRTSSGSECEREQA